MWKGVKLFAWTSTECVRIWVVEIQTAIFLLSEGIERSRVYVKMDSSFAIFQGRIEIIMRKNLNSVFKILCIKGELFEVEVAIFILM